jgi:hypothetical protein
MLIHYLVPLYGKSDSLPERTFWTTKVFNPPKASPHQPKFQVHYCSLNRTLQGCIPSEQLSAVLKICALIFSGTHILVHRNLDSGRY